MTVGTVLFFRNNFQLNDISGSAFELSNHLFYWIARKIPWTSTPRKIRGDQGSRRPGDTEVLFLQDCDDLKMKQLER